MKIATWNVERLKHKKEITQIISEIEKVQADIIVLTETDTRISLSYNFCFATSLPVSFRPDFYAPTENRVSIFSKYPCIKQYETFDKQTAICVELETEQGDLTVYGTIMGIFGNREKSFKTDLVKQMEDIRKLNRAGKDICILGDYNLTFCDNYYYTSFGRETVESTFKECGIGLLTRDRSECIDHIAVSDRFILGKSIEIEEWNYDKSLSDHKGIAVTIL